MSSDTSTTAPTDGTPLPEGAGVAAPDSADEVNLDAAQATVDEVDEAPLAEDAPPTDDGASDDAEEAVEERAEDEQATEADTDAEQDVEAESEPEDEVDADSEAEDQVEADAEAEDQVEDDTEAEDQVESAEPATESADAAEPSEATADDTVADETPADEAAAGEATGTTDAPAPLQAVRPPDIKTPVEGTGVASAPEQASRRRRWPWVAALLTAFAVFTAAGAFAGATMSYAESLEGRLLPGTTIAGVDVGGMTHDEALRGVRGALSDELDRRIVVRWRGQRWKTKARELGAKTNAKQIIGSVAASQEGLSWQDWARLRWFGERADESAVVDVTYRRGAARRFVQSIAADVDLAPTDSELSVEGADISVSPSSVGYKTTQADAVDAVMRSVEGDAEPVRLGVKKLKPAVTEDDFSQVLLLDQGDHQLTLFLDGEKSRQWLVATGTGDFPTPLGRYHIELKRYMPTWVNPSPDGWGKDMPESIPPGPKNPLGVRALNWNAPAIRFHGTQAVDSLGTDASHGCVRMHNDDVSELYDLVDVGATIISQE